MSHDQALESLEKRAIIDHFERMIGALARGHALEKRYFSETFEETRRLMKLRKRRADRERLEALRRDPSYTAAFDEAEPLVSVIIPTYNRARLIADRTLPSVVRQEYPNWEVIIVGDKVSDENAAILRSLTSARVRFHNLALRGAYPRLPGPRWHVAGTKPINFGLRVSRGRWITHLDDDDEFTPNHIAVLLREAKARRAEWVHGNVLYRESAESADPGFLIGAETPELGKISRISSLYHGGLKRFPYDLFCWQYLYPGDWDLWERFLDMGVVQAHLDETVGIHYGVNDLDKLYENDPPALETVLACGRQALHLSRLEDKLRGRENALVQEWDAQLARILNAPAEAAAAAAAVAQAEAERDRLEKELVETRRALEALQQSASWKILRKLRGARDRILPPESCRRAVADTLFSHLVTREPLADRLRKVLDLTRREGPAAVLRRLACGSDSYHRWVVEQEAGLDRAALHARIDGLVTAPLFSVLVADGGDARALEQTRRSLSAQIYGRWELVARAPRELAAAASATQGQYLLFLDAGDELGPDALAEFALRIHSAPGADILYADSDLKDALGRFSSPELKPAWSPERFEAQPYFGRPAALRSAALAEAGGLPPGLVDSLEYEAAMRVSERGGQVHHLRRVLCHRAPGAGTLPATPGGIRRVLEGHIRRSGLDAEVVAGASPAHVRLCRRIAGSPLVSIVIPTRDKVEVLRRCLASVEERTAYRRFEVIIVDNGSSDAAAVRYLRDCGHRVVVDPRPFNFSRVNNLGAQAARGEHLLFLNNDTEVIDPGWLEALLEYSQLPEVGAVGAKLYFPDGRLQHVGVTLQGGNAGHPLYTYPGEHPGAAHAACIPCDYSAVTAACLMVRRDVFEAVGGFDERFPVNYNDVDLCLRVRSAGLRVVYTPYARLYHFESSTRVNQGVQPKEERLLRERWGDLLSNDPYYQSRFGAGYLGYSREALPGCCPGVGPATPRPAGEARSAR